MRMSLPSEILGRQEVKDVQIMSGLDPVLVQYQVFAERRLHFGRMFWANIAFMIVVLLVALYFTPEEAAPLVRFLIGGLGLATVQMAYIVHRLRKMEDQCEKLMHDIEVTLKEAGHAGVLIAPRSGRFSARSMAVLSLALLGLALIGLSVFTMTLGAR
jgi:hypothetical protein